MPVPSHPKIYHIVHWNRLSSIIQEGGLLSDAIVSQRQLRGTAIGLSEIKQRRLGKLLSCYPDLHVGDCVPFYFCPRSVMLYMIHKDNFPQLTFHGGQADIIHLESDFHQAVNWVNQQNRRWAFTLSNAGSYYFKDRNDLNCLHEINWEAVQARYWETQMEGKQAEFLMESKFPFDLISRIGVLNQGTLQRVNSAISGSRFRPIVDIISEWYY